MATIRRMEDIQAWQKARVLVREVYKKCAEGNLSRDFGLRDQICRAAVSSMANIAEGYARKSDREFARFLDIARGSTIEVQTLLYVAVDVGYIDEQEFERLNRLADDTASLIGGLTSYLRGAKPGPASGKHGPEDRNLKRVATIPHVSSVVDQEWQGKRFDVRDLELEGFDPGLRTPDPGLA